MKQIPMIVATCLFLSAQAFTACMGKKKKK
jgi:hypothetical protein